MTNVYDIVNEHCQRTPPSINLILPGRKENVSYLIYKFLPSRTLIIPLSVAKRVAYLYNSSRWGHLTRVYWACPTDIPHKTRYAGLCMFISSRSLIQGSLLLVYLTTWPNYVLQRAIRRGLSNYGHFTVFISPARYITGLEWVDCHRRRTSR